MLLTEQDPTQSCTVALVTDPVELDKKRNAQEDIFQDGYKPQERGPEAVVIGHYQLQTQLGKGSTGVVWQALDLGAVQREVALKILHADYQDEHARIRFTNEVRALASLDDPHIAKVWDNGQTKDGRLYLAMELVPGLSLHKYCDTWSLSVAERIELVIKICQGIQHAHHRAILHRDLKPANILVTLVDGQPVPKIIDFGLAKSMQGPLAPAAVETTQRGCLIGTIGYMSPEQAELDQRDVDVRSDVYAICAILYELLTGTLPIQREDLHRHSLTDALKLVREKEPDLPSVRVLHEPSSSLHAARCRLSDSALAQQLKGDLDAILLKGLAKDRGQRYQSANELAEDLKRYLHGGVVEARQRTYGYVIQKLVRKHWKAAVVLTTVVSLVLASWGLTIAGYYAVREERNTVKTQRDTLQTLRDREYSAKMDALAAMDFLKGVFNKVRPGELGVQVTLLQALDHSVESLATLDAKPRVACIVRASVADSYLRLGRPESAASVLQPVLQTSLLTDEDQLLFVAPVRQVYVKVLWELDQFTAVVSTGEQFLNEFPDNGQHEFRNQRVAVNQMIAFALARQNRFDEAVDRLRQMLQQHRLGATGWGVRLALLDVLRDWGAAEPARLEEAQQLAMEYIQLAEAYSAPIIYVFHLKLKLVSALTLSKQFTAALTLLDELNELILSNKEIAAQDPNIQIFLDTQRARVHVELGQVGEAEALCRAALKRASDRYGVQHDVAQLALRSLIQVHLAHGHYWKALPLYADVEALALDKRDDYSKLEREVRNEFADTQAKAALKWALWNLR